MADLIDRDELMRKHTRSPNHDNCHDTVEELRCLLDLIDNAPAIDAAPVVRCKDCQWYDNEHFSCENEKHFYISTSWDIWISRRHDPDHFCADGKRKDGDSDGTCI